MREQVPVSEEAIVEAARGERALEVCEGVAYRRLALVNVVFLGPPGAGDREWVLVDAGLPMTANLIADAATERFGAASRPAAILMTHGHFDHVGALETLAERWDAPVYAHGLETPFLSGRESYPPPDPGVGGVMALTSPLFPRSPVDLGERLRTLPEDGSVPHAEGWRWIHTPGHTKGHVSFWRDSDRTLVAGDAVITTRQEGAYSVAAQSPEIHGPPAYFTPDWAAAETSARRVAELAPETLVTGHGRPMAGQEMRAALQHLADNFASVAVPEGRG